MKTTRRDFLKATSMASAGLLLTGIESYAASLAKAGIGNKVNIAFIGIGNRGEQVMDEFTKTDMINVVALCDIDMGAPHTLRAIANYPAAKQFKDFRKMFDAVANDIEAVVICIPDHAHFPATMLAMIHGKHVYVEKPMARTFYEVELLMRAAQKYPKVVTQVGNQGHSEANYFQFKAWMEAGIIKDVTAITAHMNNPRRWHAWDTNIKKLPDAQSIPSTLDWDNWLAQRPYHEYNEKYINGDWRCWYDFGMGALGDWGAHLLDTAHEFLLLGLPTEVNPVKIVGHNPYFYPTASTIEFQFPQRKNMPPVKLTWYDGVSNQPPLPQGYGSSILADNIPASNAGSIKQETLNPGKIIYSKDLIFKGGSHGSTLTILSEEKAKELAGKLPVVPKSTSNHFANFLLACMGKEKARSPFQIHGPLSQVFSLGVIAQQMNTKLLFDRDTKQITNNVFANALLVGDPPRKEWQEFYK